MLIYAKIKNNEIEFAPKNLGNICNFDQDVEAMEREGFKGYPEKTIADLNIGKLIIQENEFVENPNYDTEQELNKKKSKIADLQSQINELDLKSIRAMREGGEKEPGQTWLEYYTEQIQKLRVELGSLQNGKY